MRISLSPEGSQDDAPSARFPRGKDSGAAKRVERGVLVGFVREAAGVRIVPVGWKRGVGYHGAFEVEPPVAEIQEEVWNGFFFSPGIELARFDGHGGRCAAQDLALGERCDLRDDGVVAFAAQDGDYAVERCVELDRADQRYRFARGEVLRDGVEEVLGVDSDGDEDVERLDLGYCHRDQTAVRVVYQQIASQRSRGEVVDTACTIRHVSHNQRGYARAKLRQDVRYRRREEEQSLRELEGDGLGARGADSVDAFVDFEVVVGREEGNGGVDVGVVEDRVGDCVQRASGTTRLCHYTERSKISVGCS